MLLLHMPAMVITSLTQFDGHNKSVLTVVLLGVSKVFLFILLSNTASVAPGCMCFFFRLECVGRVSGLNALAECQA